jgi:CRP-like cAMP-binding protein
VGYLSVLRESRHSSSAFAREASVLLEFPAVAFREALLRHLARSSRLRHAVQASLLASMARTNRALTRLISQAKLAAAPQAGATLEAALSAQIATASPL